MAIFQRCLVLRTGIDQNVEQISSEGTSTAENSEHPRVRSNVISCNSPSGFSIAAIHDFSLHSSPSASPQSHSPSPCSSSSRLVPDALPHLDFAVVDVLPHLDCSSRFPSQNRFFLHRTDAFTCNSKSLITNRQSQVCSRSLLQLQVVTPHQVTLLSRSLLQLQIATLSLGRHPSGNLGRAEKVEPPKQKASKSPRGFDDLLPGFGSDGPASGSRSNSEPVPVLVPKETSNTMDDPFVVLESASPPITSSQVPSFIDPLETVHKINIPGQSYFPSLATSAVRTISSEV
ncbi:hypothetical protein LXL04_009894 [Taraxacum kok-saghyz]